jgi:ribonuclease D
LTLPSTLPVYIVSQPDHLVSAAREMAGVEAVALDTESNSFYRYPEQLCLIQVATRDKVYLIDAITLRDLAPLKAVLEDGSTVKAVHGADYDIRSLDRHGALHIRNLYDTSIAARFAGMAQFGLAALLKDLMGITIDKSKRLQRTDWGRRPLSPEVLRYAAADVHHLLALKDLLDERIRTLGRTAWVAEECVRQEEVRYTEPDLTTAYLSLKGAKALDGRSLAILKSLVAFREEEARRRQRPYFFVVPDAALVFLATHPTAAPEEVPGPVPGLSRLWQGIQQSLQAGLAAPPVSRPPPETDWRLDYRQSRRLDRLKAWRTAQGAALSLDPSLLWPAASLERLARAPETFETELGAEAVRRWQREQFAVSLRACLETAGAGTSP